jgi:hypothetical protein
MQAWLRKTAPTTDVTMSVCTGVKHLAKAGLLAGKSATIHHDFYDSFAKDYPDIDLRRGVRFVENEKISTSGGETCGIDLALRVVDRYFGRKVAGLIALGGATALVFVPLAFLALDFYPVCRPADAVFRETPGTARLREATRDGGRFAASSKSPHLELTYGL